MANGASLKGNVEAIVNEASKRAHLKPATCVDLFLNGFMLIDELGQPLRWEKRLSHVD